MRRVLRHFFTLCSALSLLLCVAIGVLCGWDRHQMTSREFEHGSGDRILGAYLLGDHSFVAAFQSADRHVEPGFSFRTDAGYSTAFYCLAVVHEDGVVWRRLGGFGAAHYEMRTPGAESFRTARIIMIPTWTVLLILISVPAVWFLLARRHARRAHRARAGRCPACGYDLRAHRAGERCPECGTAVEAIGAQAVS